MYIYNNCEGFELHDQFVITYTILILIIKSRKIHTQSAKKWLERLSKEEVPILVCLTFGDKLYAEHMTDGGDHPKPSDMAEVIKSQIIVSYIMITIIFIIMTK